MAAVLAALLAGCASPLPPITWLRLPAEAPGAEVPPAAPVSHEVWQLMAPVGLPGHLDRDALLVGSGGASLQPLGGVRWAEPLRDVVPRLLRADLTRAWGAPVWTAPLPPGVRPTRQLRVEFSALDVTADGRGVQLQARWSLADALGAAPPQVGEATFVTPASGADADALAAAHRRALQQLAQRIVAAAR
ncbi:MAG: hypothetical protein A3E25_13905 [Burkholderiales bacterium RIFCSPHIGHO2_12_FULL_69_20]|nr:MAG: hypothetical protein A3E25_13905 [Burkholderiales bacterium RIFCSPHIGHO2_12_FULL_69_20]